MVGLRYELWIHNRVDRNNGLCRQHTFSRRYGGLLVVSSSGQQPLFTRFSLTLHSTVGLCCMVGVPF